MQGEKMVETPVARVLLHSVAVPKPKEKIDFGDPVLERYAQRGLVITSREDERTMQLVSVRLVADSMRRIMPSREAEINVAEQEACSGAKRRDGTPAVVWPKGEFLALLPADLTLIATRKFVDADILEGSKRIFQQLKDEVKVAQAQAAHAAQPQQPARAQAAA